MSAHDLLGVMAHGPPEDEDGPDMDHSAGTQRRGLG